MKAKHNHGCGKQLHPIFHAGAASRLWTWARCLMAGGRVLITVTTHCHEMIASMSARKSYQVFQGDGPSWDRPERASCHGPLYLRKAAKNPAEWGGTHAASTRVATISSYAKNTKRAPKTLMKFLKFSMCLERYLEK